MPIQSTSGQGLSVLSSVFSKRNESSIRLIADAMPQIVWIADADGTIEYFNRAWLDFTGRTLEESLGLGWQSALQPDDLLKCHGLWLDSVKAGTPLQTECRLRRASDGAYRWHLVRAHALRDDTGTAIKWVGNCSDIDDQKVAQQALRDAVADVERQVRDRTAELLTTNMQLLDAISERRQAAANHEQDTQRLNDIIATQALLAQAGLSLSSFLNLAAQKIHRLTGATGTVVELIEDEELVYAAATGKTAPFLGMRLNISGSLSGLCIQMRKVLKCDDSRDDPRVDLASCLKVGAVSLLVAPLFDKGVPIGVLKILSDSPNAFGQRDVQTLELMAGLLGAAVAQQIHRQTSDRLLAERTEALSALQAEVESRLQSEQQLREIEYRARRILESSHDAFFSTDGNGIVREWNEEAALLFGWPKQDVMGRQLDTLLIPEAARDEIRAAIGWISRDTELAPVVKRVALQAQHRLGHPLAVEFSISSLHYRETRNVNFFVRDVGARQRTESRLAAIQGILRKIADGLPARVAYIDAEERYRFVNLYYESVGGMAREDMLGRTLEEVMGESRYAAIKDKVGMALSGKEVHYERSAITKAGAIRQLVHYFPDLDEFGAVAGFYSVVTEAGNSRTDLSSGGL